MCIPKRRVYDAGSQERRWKRCDNIQLGSKEQGDNSKNTESEYTELNYAQKSEIVAVTEQRAYLMRILIGRKTNIMHAVTAPGYKIQAKHSNQ